MKKVLFIIALAMSMTQMNAQDHGGKWLEKKSEFLGKPFVFSNRGETEAIEKLVAAYNNIDARACAALCAEKVTITNFEGNKVIMTSKEWEGYFASYKSLNWQVSAIVPIRIKDSDPTSGVIVFATETRINTDGMIWKKQLVEFFSFNLEMKIDGISQYYQDVK
jgi:hypothetical protein